MNEAATAGGVVVVDDRGVGGASIRVRIALVDTGGPPAGAFGTRLAPGARVETWPGHGTMMAAAIHDVARDAEILVISVGRDPAGALRQAGEMSPHLVVCAWGCGPRPDVVAAIEPLAAQLLTTLDPRRAALAPACCPGVRIITEASGWPRGPRRLPGFARRWGGSSAALASAAGTAAALVNQGWPVWAALDHVAAAAPHRPSPSLPAWSA